MEAGCIVPFYLAYLMAIYLFASIYYLLKTRTIGTPFRDSLTQEQLMIKMVASEVRSRIFLNGVLLGGLLLIRVYFYYKKRNQSRTKGD